MASFNKVTLPIGVEKRSDVNMSAIHVGSTDFGRMDVVYHTELIRGDNVKMKLTSMLRAAPMPCPTFGKFRRSLRVFFVPHRILTAPANFNAGTFSWDEWINGQTSSSHPYFSVSSLKLVYAGSASASPLISSLPSWRDACRLASQLRFPAYIYHMSKDPTIPSTNVARFNPFPAAAYQRIFWDWYRDASLIDETRASEVVALKVLLQRFCSADELHRNTCSTLCSERTR